MAKNQAGTSGKDDKGQGKEQVKSFDLQEVDKAFRPGQTYQEQRRLGKELGIGPAENEYPDYFPDNEAGSEGK